MRNVCNSHSVFWSRLSVSYVSVKIFICLIAGLLTFSTRAQLTLAENGISHYQIVVSSNAIPSERYAAEELQRYLEKISGAKLPLISDAKPSNTREILIGDNAHLQSLGLALDYHKLGSEGFVLATKENRLLICGGKPRGTLYGVYTLLEEQFGVRWFTPEVEVAPRTNRIALPSLEQTRVPALEYREVFWREILRDADFAARHRLNGEHYALNDKHGGRGKVYFPFVHSFDQLIPRDLYKEHPDYFPLRKGKRLQGYVQRCLSNPSVIKLAKETVHRWIKEHPDASIISVSQNDTGNWCQCETCKALDDAEESPTASLVQFVNTIAEDIEKDYPNIRIDTLAYQYTRKPPKTLRPRRNVIIRLCSIECCFAHPLETCVSGQNAKFRADIAAWEPVASNLYIWDYTPNFAHYQQPFPNFGALQPNVQFFVKHHVNGLFEQGNYSSGGYGEMGPLRAYVLAKLLWNPDTDVQKHIQEFTDGYYGKAAPQMREYVALLEAQVREPQTHAFIYDPPTSAYLNESFLVAADKLLTVVEKAADNEATRFRVETAHLPIWYVQLASNRVTGDSRADLLARFLTVARKVGISNISEGQALDAWAKSQGAK